MPAIMLSPVPAKSFGCSSGNVYLADQYGVVPNVTLTDDVAELINQGCIQLSPPVPLIGRLSGDELGRLLGVNFNVTTDQLIPVNNVLKFRPKKIVVLNTSVNGMSTAAGGIYTGPGKTGTQIVAAAQVYTGLTNAATALELTLNAPTLVLAALSALYFNLTTPQGAAATADIYIFGESYPTSL